MPLLIPGRIEILALHPAHSRNPSLASIPPMTVLVLSWVPDAVAVGCQCPVSVLSRPLLSHGYLRRRLRAGKYLNPKYV